MLALAMYRAERHDCGHLLSESTDPSAEFAYRAELPIRCHACTTLERAQEQASKDYPQPGALLWRVSKTERR